MDSRSAFRPRSRLAAFFLAVAAGLFFFPPSSFAQTILFAKPKNFAVLASPRSVAVGDFNGDGIPDVAVPNSGKGNVSILLGSVAFDGTRTFSPAVNYPVENEPYSIVAADFNRDGKQDLAVANRLSNNVSILLGNGDGTFADATNSPITVGTLPRSLVVGDFDRDGKLDLAVANSGSDNVSVLLGNGDGTFDSNTDFNVGAMPSALAVADFNADGRPDLAVANRGSSNVSILLNSGGSSFSAATNLAMDGIPTSVALGDFDGDGDLDLAVTSLSTSKLSIFLGDGNGTFTLLAKFASGSSPQAILVGDFNGDGKLDLAITGSKINVVPGNGDGTFGLLKAFSAGSVPFFSAPIDFNADGRTDLAVANSGSGTVSILVNTTAFSWAGAFKAPADVSVGDDPVSVATGDFDRDGKLDLAVANAGDGNVSIRLGNGDGTFTLEPTGSPFAAGTEPSSVLAADFDGDDVLDLAVTDKGDHKVYILLGVGNGTFDAAVGYDVGAEPSSVVAGDFDRDGALDLAVANLGDNNVSILRGNGNGTFTEEATESSISVGDTPVAAVVGDWDGDGKQDLAVVNSVDGTVSIFRGNGDGTFDPASTPTLTAGTAPSSGVVGDYDGDGKQDLAVANSGDDNVSVFLGNGDATFDAATDSPFTVGDAPQSLVAADFNRDGKLDLAVANFDGSNVTILPGDGTGFFENGLDSPFTTGTNPTALAIGDFDRDGRLDLVSANEGSDNVSILINTAPSPVVLTPEAGDTLLVKSLATITWIFDGAGPFVNVQINRTAAIGGTTWTTILKKTPNDGIQTWKVTTPTTVGATARIRVCNVTVLTDCTPESEDFAVSLP